MSALSQSPDVDVHEVLVGISDRLESLWLSTCVAAEAQGDRRAREGWRSARDELVAAMSALEGYAGRLDPRLGRRDWRTREVTVAALPRQRGQVTDRDR